MKYLSEGSNAALTSVADWKPISHERFAELLQLYATFCSADVPGDHGNEGMAGVWCQAFRHDRQTTATIWYMPASGKAPSGVSSPVLLVLGSPGKTVCFEHLSYGLERPTDDERMRNPAIEEWKAKGKCPLVRRLPTPACLKGDLTA